MKKIALVTGASSGVGYSIAKYLLENDYLVIAGARRVDVMKKKFNDYQNVYISYLDLSDQNSIYDLTSNILDRYQYIPYIINNSGVLIKKKMRLLSDEEILYSFKVNALGPSIIVKELIGEMQNKNYGRIINLTSGAPLNCFEEFSAYSASKSALNSLTVTAANEYKQYNIKINLMSPGPVRSEMSPNSSMDPSMCHPTVKYLLNLEENGPSGKFFWLGYEVPLFPNLEGIDWLNGEGCGKLKKVL